MKYRAEIDGLRAIAVIPVILFHAGFSLFSGGFVGVDVFFVISGYLITTILINDIENKRFSIVTFYEKRARRIIPALFLVMMLCVPLAWMLLADASLGKFGTGLIGVSIFLSNVVFWQQQGYFDESAELNPILHTWSLAVEEQYYVLFPIFLFFAWRFGKNKVFWIILIIAAMSLFLSEWGWRNQATANFYLSPTRAWELLAGSIAAFITHNQGVQKNNYLASLGLAAIIFTVFAYDASTPFPSLYALIPVLGTVLLVLYASEETFAARLLSARAFVGIGLISYSAYLWHQPVFAFFRVYSNQISLNWLAALALITITLFLSYMSWRYIEKPFRNKNLTSKKFIFNFSFFALASLLLIGYASKKAVIGGEYRLAKQLSENDFVYFENLDERKFLEGRLLYPLEPVNTIVVGSSRVMQINSSIVDRKIQSFTVSGASIEDDIAFGLEALAKLNYKEIYISADPWLLNKNDEQDRYQSVDALVNYWQNRMEMNLPPLAFLNSKLYDSENQFTRSKLVSLRNFLMIDKNRMIPTDDEPEAYAKKSYDGSLIYSNSYISQANDVESGFAGLLNYAMTDFAYDSISIKKLENFVSYLQKNGVSVNLVLSPYHPQLYKMMSTQKPIFLEIEKWYRKFADSKGIEIIGSYSANTVGCEKREFYDGMHPTAQCMQKIFSHLNE